MRPRPSSPRTGRPVPGLAAVLAAAAFVAGAGAACGQDFEPPDGKFAVLLQETAAENPPAGDPPEAPLAAAPFDPAEPALSRRAFARAELARLGTENPLPQSGPVVVAYERAGLHAARRDRAYVRVLAGVVRVHNADPNRVASIGPGVVLRAGAATLRPNAAPEGVSTRPDHLAGTAEDWETAREVPPGGTREFPASFFDPPGGPDVLPDPLVLVVPVTLAPPEPDGDGEGGEEEVAGGGANPESFVIEHDVAAYHRGLAGLRSRRTGPAGALGVLTVTGELTHLGRYAAVARLRALGAAGVRRGVLLWAPARLGPPDPRRAGGKGEAEPTLVAAVPPLPPAPAGPDGAGGPRFDPARSAGSSRRRLRGRGSPATAAGLAEFRLATDPTADLGGEDRAVDPALAAAVAADRPRARRLAVAAGAGGGSTGPAGDFGPTRDEPADAAADALRTALRALDAGAAERQIVGGDPLVRPGAVRHAGPTLPADKLPLLTGLLGNEGEDPALRAAAAAALGSFDRPAARDALTAAVRGTAGEGLSKGAEPLAAAAAEALATSRFPGGPAALAGLVGEAGGDLPAGVFKVLADHPHPAWRDTLAALAADPDAPARAAALRVLAADDDPAAGRLVRDAVAGDGPAAAAAFALLSDDPDPAADAARADYARRALLAAGPDRPLDAGVLAYLAAARPGWAAGPLWDLFARTEPGDRAGLIALLARLAGDEGGDGGLSREDGLSREELGGRLADRWDDLKDSERRAALAAVADLAPGRLADLAGPALESGSESTENAALLALERADAPAAEVVVLLSAAFAAAPDLDAAIRLGRRLAWRASPAARAAILERRWSGVPHVAEVARDLAGQLHLYGPGRAFFDRALDLTRTVPEDPRAPGGPADPVERRTPENYDRSVPLLAAGLSLDPAAASGWSGKAFALGQAGRLPEAREAFRKAQSLDPFDNLALTGLAILEIELGGDLDAAFARAERGLEKYPDDYLFAYNLACVYGVAAKARLRETGADDPADDPDAARFLGQALEHLVRSYRLSPTVGGEAGGFRSPAQRAHTARDPDLELLRGDPTFERIVAGTFPAPEDAGDGAPPDPSGEALPEDDLMEEAAP